MSSGHRDDRPALIALALLLLAICLVGLFEGTARHYASQEIAKYETAYPRDGAPQEYAPIISSLREFDPREDTYAQWMMAAFSVVATLASVFAVVLLKDTLAATREAVRAADDAVKVTRVLGQAQVRAYLNCVGGDYTFGDDFISIQVHLTNSGQSPAVWSRVTGRITALAPKGVPGTALGMKVLPLNLFAAEFTGIPSGGAVVKSHLTAFDNQRVNETFKALGRGSWYFYVQCKMSWIDVFGDEQTLSFFLSQTGKDESGETPNGFRRSGGLEARNTKPNPDESNN